MSRLREGTSLGPQDAEAFRFAVVASRTNSEVTSQLLSGALETLARYGAGTDRVRVVEVPGAFELPMAAAKIAYAKDVDAIICLGALVRGETPHFDYLSVSVAWGLQSVAIRMGIPVTFGVLTCDSLEQAMARAGGSKGNKGSEAAVAAIEMARGFGSLVTE